ncbi:MAG: undecaprenyl-diphospho-oligosaccharide flippase [Gammaproteobacteria bacterium]|nr:undecaprenyl-diphospho-oligosaccharide flippase [Gammaproteobacteria bacterium]
MAQSDSSAGRLVKHSSIYAIGNISRQLVGFLMLPLYTHYLTPADYGVVGLLTFALALLEPFFGARLGDAMLKFYYEAKDETQQRLVISTSLVITGVVSAAVATIAFLARAPASQLIFGTAEYALPVGLMSYVFLTQALESYGLTYVRIRRKPFLFISINLSKLVLQLSLNIWFIVYLKLGITGVVLSGVISSALYALGLSLYSMYYNGATCDIQIAKRMLVFSWPLWVSSLASLYIYSSNRYYIRLFGSMDQVGYYELAARFAGLLGVVIWQPISQFWETERFRHYQQPHARTIFGSVFEFSSMLLFIGALGLSIFSEPVIHFMAAPAFHNAALLVPLLAFGWLFGYLTLFVNFSFLVTEKTVLISRNNYITVAIVTALNFILVPRFGYIGAGCAQLLALFLQFLLVRASARPHYDMGLRLTPILAMAGLSAGGYLLANRVLHISWVPLDLLWKALVCAVTAALLLGVVLLSAPNRKQVVRLLDSLVFPLMRKLRLMPQL